MVSTPKNKQENYELYHRGYYGNHLKFWISLEDFFIDLDTGAWSVEEPVVLRTVHLPGIKLPDYCSRTKPSEVTALATRWVKDYGVKFDQIVLNEIGPDKDIVLQGEIMRTERHYDLYFSTMQVMMRKALRWNPQHACGLAAIKRVEQVMDDSSFDNLHRLFDEFPDAIIEFSTYAVPLGVLKLNTVFWEVRAY
jgi:hypothetical protein